jgi:acyl carrier protein
LYIGGVILASGYINQPELTAERFVDSPFAADQKLYRTGDRVRQLPDGKFEFLGRVDNQVSLRGVRIECGEIESLLTSHPSIKSAVAHVVVLPNGEKALVAYYTTDVVDTDFDTLNEELRTYLSTQLPDYMRPTVFQHLDAFPLNPNGKVDRKALPMPKRESRNLNASTSTEHTLVNLWQTLLGLDRVGVETNFFELGGNSLLATKLVNQCKKCFEIDLPVTALFEAPTIHTLAALIDGIGRNKMMSALMSALMYESAAAPLAENEILV